MGRDNKNNFITVVAGDVKKYYNDEYCLNRIKLRDIPIEFLSSNLLMFAIKKEPKNLIEYLLELSENKLIQEDILKYIKMIPIGLSSIKTFAVLDIVNITIWNGTIIENTKA